MVYEALVGLGIGRLGHNASQSLSSVRIVNIGHPLPGEQGSYGAKLVTPDPEVVNSHL